MKRILLPAVVFLALAIPMQSASAAVCPKGKMVDSCIDHINNLERVGNQLAQCFRDLNAEYHGETGNGAGKGQNFKDKKDDCIQLAQDALADIKDAYVPGGDTSLRRTLRKAVKNWKAAE